MIAATSKRSMGTTWRVTPSRHRIHPAPLHPAATGWSATITTTTTNTTTITNTSSSSPKWPSNRMGPAATGSTGWCTTFLGSSTRSGDIESSVHQTPSPLLPTSSSCCSQLQVLNNPSPSSSSSLLMNQTFMVCGRFPPYLSSVWHYLLTSWAVLP